jgi:AP-3 complex subunit mu
MALSLHPSPTAHPTAIVGPSLHPCVRTRRWTREGILSFVPPDGAFELAQFSVPFSSSARSGKSLAAAASSSTDATGWAKDVPFTLKAKRSPVKESKGREWTFEITLSAKSGRSGPTCSEGVEVSFHVSPQAGSEADATLGSPNVDARASVSNRAALSGGPGVASSYTGLGADDPGVWRFDAREGLVRWSIPRLGSSPLSSSASSSSAAAPSAGAGPSEVTLKGTITASSSSSSSSSSSTSSAALSKPSALLVAFSLPLGQPSLSGVRVASLHITGVDYKPFKGVRGATRGRIEWRW